MYSKRLRRYSAIPEDNEQKAFIKATEGIRQTIYEDAGFPVQQTDTGGNL